MDGVSRLEMKICSIRKEEIGRKRKSQSLKIRIGRGVCLHFGKQNKVVNPGIRSDPEDEEYHPKDVQCPPVQNPDRAYRKTN